MTVRNTHLAIIDNQSSLDGATAWISSFNPELSLAVTATSWEGFMLDRLTASPAELDGVVIDMDLPDPVHILTKLRSLKASEVGVIVTGTNPDIAFVGAALDAGASGFICKTEGLSTLTDAVHAVASGDPYISSGMEDELRSAGAGSRYPKLPPQEICVLAGFASGLTMKRVANQLGIAECTAKGYLKKTRATCREAGFEIGTRVLTREYALARGYLTA